MLVVAIFISRYSFGSPTAEIDEGYLTDVGGKAVCPRFRKKLDDLDYALNPVRQKDGNTNRRIAQ